MKKDVNELSKAALEKIARKWREHIHSRSKGGKKGGKSKWESMTVDERIKHIQKMNEARKLNNPS